MEMELCFRHGRVGPLNRCAPTGFDLFARGWQAASHGGRRFRENGRTAAGSGGISNRYLFLSKKTAGGLEKVSACLYGSPLGIDDDPRGEILFICV